MVPKELIEKIYDIPVSFTREGIISNAKKLSCVPGNRLSDIAVSKVPLDANQIKRADIIAGGTVYFYGTEEVEVGLKDIDWEGGHRKHQEWPTQLNRFSYLHDLAAAYRSTGDEKYAKAARSYMEDWIDSHGDRNLPTGVRVRNVLCTSIRLGSSMMEGWGGCLPLFLKSPHFDDAFLQKIFISISAQAERMIADPVFCGNWGISEFDSLIITALRFPFLHNAQRMLEIGIRWMRKGLRAQFYSDGAHIEGCPSYAEWMTAVLCHYALLEKSFPQLRLGITRKRIEQAWEYILHGEHVPFNDSWSRSTDEYKALPKAQKWLSAIYGDELSNWLPPTNGIFPVMGQVMLRSSWEKNAEVLAFDLSHHGGSHTHRSRLSFTYQHQGTLLVADPGITSYESSDPMHVYGRSTLSHSTLNVDNLDQGTARAEFEDAVYGDRVNILYGSYMGGYWEGVPDWSCQIDTGVYAKHSRTLFQLKNEYVIVLDALAGKEGQTINNVFQLGDLKNWSSDSAALSGHSAGDDVNLAMHMLLAPEGEIRMNTACGEKNPPRGWLGPNYASACRPAPRVEFSYPGGMPNSGLSGVLLYPFSGTTKPDITICDSKEITGETDAAFKASAMGFSRPDGGRDELYWAYNPIATIGVCERLNTDAALLWIRRNTAGVIEEMYGHDVSYVEYDGKLEWVSDTAVKGMLLGLTHQNNKL